MSLQAIVTEPRFWVAVAIVIFIALASRKLWSVAVAILDQRAEVIRAELDEAASLRAEAEAMLVDASARRDAALKEAAALLATARAEAARLAEDAREEGAANSKRREKMALDRISAAEKAALVEVRDQAAVIAIHVAEAIIREGLPTAAAAGLVRNAIDALPKALAAQ